MSLLTPAATRSGRIAPPWPLLAAAAVLAALWTSPLPAIARTSFTSHMLLHLGVMIVAAPLAALGLARLRPWPARAPAMTLALLGAGMELAVVWGWHAPVLHRAAATLPAAFALQQASFLAAGILVWLPGLAVGGRAGAAAGAVSMAMCLAHMSMLGVILGTSPRLIYAPEICLGGLGLSPLDDQRLGGVIMALGGGLPYLAGALLFARRLIADAPPAGTPPAGRGAPAAGPDRRRPTPQVAR